MGFIVRVLIAAMFLTVSPWVALFIFVALCFANAFAVQDEKLWKDWPPQ